MLICALCEKTSNNYKDSPWLIHSFPHSYLYVGEHQTFPGYCLLVLKSHVSRLHELEPAIQIALHQELISAGTAINHAFKPTQINYACYGNLTPHVHWHLFPRFENDAAWPKPPWSIMDSFAQHTTSVLQAKSIKESLLNHLPI
ncbi:MAG: histidine triad protein [Francisellaceae bacterium]|nr:histidine triad protein [Francisellaceae bacterium]